MTYYAGTINYTITPGARFDTIRANTSAACVQIYVDGTLKEGKIPDGNGVEFNIDPLNFHEYIHLLSVDVADIDTDYFAQAFSSHATAGSRIKVTTPTECGWLRGYLWRVYLGSTLVHERDVWPYPDSPSCRIGGRGSHRGHRRGREDYGSGRGNWRGRQRGYEPIPLIFKTLPQTPGSFSIKTAIVDTAGNESTLTTQNYTLDSYPRPATSPGVDSYVQGTDTLTITFTASPDV